MEVVYKLIVMLVRSVALTASCETCKECCSVSFMVELMGLTGCSAAYNRQTYTLDHTSTGTLSLVQAHKQ